MATKWLFRITAAHILENLATDLYKNPSDCIWEIVRNGIVASMPGNKWVPGAGDIEITMTDNHPLSPKSSALIVLDHGSGFTKPAIDKFCSLGAPLVGGKLQSHGTHSGAAQKCIGRFAAFALNDECRERNPDTGFYVATRTAPKGLITFVEMIPSEIERLQGVEPRFLEPSDTTLGSQRNIAGSFTAIIIPNPVFTSYEEIRRALMWRIPRKQDMMFKLQVGGRTLHPPPLASRITMSSAKGDIEVFIDKCDDDDADSGIWLTDATTGLRVACGRGLSQIIPYPLWRPDLTGDILVPGLLENQDTSRTGLRSKFLRSAAWRSATSFMVGQVAERARALLDDEDVFGRDQFDRIVTDFVDQCRRIWGVPESTGTDGGFGAPRRTPREGGDPGRGRGGTHGPRRPQRQPTIPIKIGSDEYELSKRQLDPLILAQVDTSNGRVIYLNAVGYQPMPTARTARTEHVLLKILEAVGAAKFPSDPIEVTRFVGERRLDFLRKERKR